jgi:hypothetical protein
MKITVTCGCGSTFEAPSQLAGQTVRCPSCRAPLAVPTEVPAASEPELDLNDLSALDQVSLDASTQGSTVGRSAMGGTARGGSMGGSRIKRAASGKSSTGDQAISQEVDDRMTRMYEVYSGKKMNFGGGSGSKLKLVIGLGIALVTIGGGIMIGVQVLKTEYSDSLDKMGNIISGEGGDSIDVPVVEKARTQNANASEQWLAPVSSQLSSAELANTLVQADAQDESRITFEVQIVPVSKASDRRLSMATSVALFRSLHADGPFTQVDRVKVDGFDSATGSLTFELFDAELAGLETNQLHYRLSGYDSDRKRLFDTPAAGFAYISTPVVQGGRVLWKPRAVDQPIPAIRIGARLDAPGWEEVLLWQVVADGPINQSLPDLPGGLPMVVESSVYRPIQIELDTRGLGRWQMQWVGHELNRLGKAGATVTGVAPFAYANRLDYRMTPDEEQFSSVSKSWDSSGQAGVSRVVMFTPDGGPTQTAAVVSPAVLTDITATAYDGRVHLSWDSSALLAGLDRYAGQIEIAVRRIDEHGGESMVARLPVDSTGYTDTDVLNGLKVTNEVSLVQAGGAADPMVHADAWVKGHGALAVMTAFPFTNMTTRVSPELGLDRLHVSLGINELSYAGSGLSSVTLHNRLVELLTQTPGLVVVDRASQRSFVGAPALTGVNTTLWGSAAQVHLRLVDSTTSDGNLLSLWATDMATGQPRLIARVNAAQAVDQADLFVTKLQTYLESRMPSGVPDAPVAGEAPSLVVVGPIHPVDQPVLYYRTAELAEQLAQAGDQMPGGLPVVSRRFWLDDTQQDPGAIDHNGLGGAVLVVGRAWTSEDSLPGVSLRAVDAASGKLIDRFETDRLTPQALREFADWCVSLRALPNTESGDESPLLLAESSLAHIHPVWRDAASNQRGSGHQGSLSNTSGTDNQDGPVLSFGLPMPMALSGLQEVVERDIDHPLYMLRPYVAPQHPLTFEGWVKAYAQYIEADSAAFVAGFEQVRRVQQANPGPIYPRLILRGEHKFIGDGSIPSAASGFRVSPAALNVRTFFPMGVAGQPMIDYREDLSRAYRTRPWMLSRAWKLVKTPIAEPFMRGELFGVKDGRYGRLTFPEKPAPFVSYIAARLLADMGNREAFTYKQKSLALAAQALTELTESGRGSLNEEQMKWATDALLVLIYEKDPGTIKRLSDQRFRQRFLSVEPDMQSDVLRMLIDQAGPVAWEWAGEFQSIEWAGFCWQSRDEMDMVTLSRADLFSETELLAIRTWLDKDDLPLGDGQSLDGESDTTAVSGPSGSLRSN